MTLIYMKLPLSGTSNEQLEPRLTRVNLLLTPALPDNVPSFVIDDGALELGEKKQFLQLPQITP